MRVITFFLPFPHFLIFQPCSLLPAPPLFFHKMKYPSVAAKQLVISVYTIVAMEQRFIYIKVEEYQGRHRSPLPVGQCYNVTYLKYKSHLLYHPWAGHGASCPSSSISGGCGRWWIPGYLQPFYGLFLADHTMWRDRVVVAIYPFEDAMATIHHNPSVSDFW